MNKILFFIITITCINLNIVAQQKSFTKLELGVKGGVNFTTATYNIEDSKFRLGYNGGITMNYYFYEDIYLNTGIEYTTKGADIKRKYTKDS